MMKTGGTLKDNVTMGKTYTTADGREVRVFALDGGSDYPVLGAIRHDNGCWVSARWTVNGLFFNDSCNHPSSLVEAAPRIAGYVDIDISGGIPFVVGWRIAEGGAAPNAVSAPRDKNKRDTRVRFNFNVEKGSGL